MSHYGGQWLVRETRAAKTVRFQANGVIVYGFLNKRSDKSSSFSLSLSRFSFCPELLACNTARLINNWGGGGVERIK